MKGKNREAFLTARDRLETIYNIESFAKEKAITNAKIEEAYPGRKLVEYQRELEQFMKGINSELLVAEYNIIKSDLASMSDIEGFEKIKQKMQIISKLLEIKQGQIDVRFCRCILDFIYEYTEFEKEYRTSLLDSDVQKLGSSA